ncbi:hypothetical protein SAZ11_03120 [Streptomyces sp. FXJ1.4098]|nr:hypothetical protein [Streptomyces sp. FXJ1.4098]
MHTGRGDQPGKGVVLGLSLGAQQARGGGGHAAGRAGGQQLGASGGHRRRRRAVLDLPRRRPHVMGRGLGGESGIGEQSAHELVVPEQPVTRGAGGGVADGQVQRGLCDARRPRGDEEPPQGEAGRRDERDAGSRSPHRSDGGGGRPVEGDAGQPRGAQPRGAGFGLDPHTAARVHERAAVQAVRETEDEVGVGDLAERQPALHTGDAQGVAVAVDPGGQCPGIGAALGLGEGEGGDDPAGGQLGQDGVADLRGGPAAQGVADHGVDHEQAVQAGRGGGHEPVHVDDVHQREIAAVVRGVDGDAEQSEAGQVVDVLPGDGTRALPHRGAVGELLAPQHVEDRFRRCGAHAATLRATRAASPRTESKLTSSRSSSVTSTWKVRSTKSTIWTAAIESSTPPEMSGRSSSMPGRPLSRVMNPRTTAVTSSVVGVL